VKLFFLSSFAHLALDPQANRVSGGAELQVALLARELAARNYDVVVAGGDIGQGDNVVLQGVRTRPAGPFHTGGLLDSLRALPRVWQLLAEEKPDYVLVLGWTSWLFILHLLKPFFGFRLVFICGLDTEVNGEFRRENPVRGWLFEQGMRRSDQRFAMTRLQERLFREAGMSCALYRNLILPRAAERSGSKTVDFLWVARCQPIKQPHRFLDLAESLPEARCEMICPREDAALWATVAERAAKLPNVTFRNGVPYREVQAHYDSARVFVNTSTFEGWPNSFIQAGLAETAILSLQVRPDTIFDDYELGVCADGDGEAFLKKAREWLADSERTGRMGREAKRFVVELHNNARETEVFLAGLPPLKK
jgi:glycosyltransferase involved in cell wall biosynthesis